MSLLDILNTTMTKTNPLAPSYHGSLWGLFRDRAGSIIQQAMDQADNHFNTASRVAGGFRGNIERHLKEHLAKIPYYASGYSNNMTVSKEIQQEVAVVVNESMQEMNITTDADFRQELVKDLDEGLERNAWSVLLSNATDLSPEPAGYGDHDYQDFFHKMPIKDETMFVALLSVGILVPVIFFTLIGIFFYKKRRENNERRQEMLLRDQPEFSMDEYPKTSGEEDLCGVPDLDFKGYRDVL